MEKEVFYFGRGSSECLAAYYSPGERIKVFVGNGKTREKGEEVVLMEKDLDELVKFFEALRDKTMHDFIRERAYPGVPIENYIEYERTHE